MRIESDGQLADAATDLARVHRGESDLQTVAPQLSAAVAPERRHVDLSLRRRIRSRLAVGVLAATTQLPLPAWARGLVVGLLVSIPDAIITKAYAPILAAGAIGGTLIGWAAGKWARPD